MMDEKKPGGRRWNTMDDGLIEGIEPKEILIGKEDLERVRKMAGETCQVLLSERFGIGPWSMLDPELVKYKGKPGWMAAICLTFPKSTIKPDDAIIGEIIVGEDFRPLYITPNEKLLKNMEELADKLGGKK
ncbi:MAG: hypothetical protein V1744_07840 [Candidatus Altiarchaeota archaeon]